MNDGIKLWLVSMCVLPAALFVAMVWRREERVRSGWEIAARLLLPILSVLPPAVAVLWVDPLSIFWSLVLKHPVLAGFTLGSVNATYAWGAVELAYRPRHLAWMWSSDSVRVKTRLLISLSITALLVLGIYHLQNLKLEDQSWGPVVALTWPVGCAIGLLLLGMLDGDVTFWRREERLLRAAEITAATHRPNPYT